MPSPHPHAFAAALCLLSTAIAAPPAVADAPEVSDQAPQIALEAILQAPADVAPDAAPRPGRVTVIDFWATWCAPCIVTFPHLNDLAEELANEPFDFLLITDESEEVVQRFLEKRPMRAWMGVDTDRSTFDAFNIRALPTTVVIDKKGRIAAITEPDQLSSEALRTIAAGRPVTLDDNNAVAAAYMEDAWASGEPFLQLRIQAAAPDKPRMTSTGHGRYEAVGAPLRNLIAAAFEHPRTRIRASMPIDARFTVQAKVPVDGDAIATAYAEYRETGALNLPPSVLRARERHAALLRHAVVAAFDIDVRRETVDSDVYILERIAGVDLGLRPGEGDQGRSSSDDGVLVATNFAIDSLVQSLESELGAPVINETGLAGKFDWDLQWTPEDKQSLIDAVREQLGLALTSAVRPVEYLLVDRAE